MTHDEFWKWAEAEVMPVLMRRMVKRQRDLRQRLKAWKDIKPGTKIRIRIPDAVEASR